MVGNTKSLWGAVLAPKGNLSGEIAFKIRDSLSIYEAAMIASGRHPLPRLLSGADIKAYEQVLRAGINRTDEHRELAQQSCAMFKAITAAIELGKINPTKLVYISKEKIDLRFTRVKTEDVARIRENGWSPKLSRRRFGILGKVFTTTVKPSLDGACAPRKKPFPLAREEELRAFLVEHARKQESQGKPNNDEEARAVAEKHFKATIPRERIRRIRTDENCTGQSGRKSAVNSAEK